MSPPPEELSSSKAQVPEAWTQEEDSRILQGVATHGFKWKKIAQDIPGRSGDAVRNRYQRLKAAAAVGVHDSMGSEPPPLDGSAVAVASTAASSASAMMPPPPAKPAAFATAIPLGAGSSKQLGPVSSQPVPEPSSVNGGGAVISMAEITESMGSISSGCSSVLRSAPAGRPSLDKSFTQAASSSWSSLPEGLVQATALPQPTPQQQPPSAPTQPMRPPQVPVGSPIPAAASTSAPATSMAPMNRPLAPQASNAPSVLSPSDPFAQMLAAAVPSVLKPGTRFQPTGHIVSSLADDLDFDSSSSSLESHSRSRSKTNFYDRSR